MAAQLLLLSLPSPLLLLSRPCNTKFNQLIKINSAAAARVAAERRLHSSGASARQDYYPHHYARRFSRRRPWLLCPPPPPCRALLPVRSSLHETISSSVEPVASAAAHHLGHQHPYSSFLMTMLFFLADSDSVLGGGYSQASYYTSLGLFVISVPGLWSLIKRSVKSKIVQKTFTVSGEENMRPNQVAGAILSFFTRNNFVVLETGETITFEGMMIPNRSQAALLTFCTCISLASVALVLTITVPDVGNNWFWLTILSPLAGAYYWTRASRKEQIKVKMIVADNGLSEIIVQGDDQQVDRMRRELQLTEKGMIYVKGIFER